MIDLKSVSRGCMKFATLEQNRKSWWKKNQHPKIRICEERARVITSVKRKLAKLLFETCEGLFFFNINIIFRFTPSYDMINYSLEAIDKFYYFFFLTFRFETLRLPFRFFSDCRLREDGVYSAGRVCGVQSPSQSRTQCYDITDGEERKIV